MAGEKDRIPEVSPPSKKKAWLFTVVAVLLAFLSGLEALIWGTSVQYSPTLAILSATLIAVIWYTQFTFEALQHSKQKEERERKEAKGVFATGLLIEVRSIEEVLTFICEHGPFMVTNHFRYPLLRQSLTVPHLFTPTTIALLVEFYRFVEILHFEVNVYEEVPEKVFGTKESQSYFEDRQQRRSDLKKMAYKGIQLIRPLVEALVGEGGIKYLRKFDEQIPDDIPALPPSPFGKRRR